jgi:hypothetical protein
MGPRGDLSVRDSNPGLSFCRIEHEGQSRRENREQSKLPDQADSLSQETDERAGIVDWMQYFIRPLASKYLENVIVAIAFRPS